MTTHDASASAIGYIYQIKWALLEFVKGARDRPEQAISLEQFDDVAWDDQGTPVELLQTKHHAPNAGSLGDRSPDVWRTLKVWMDDPVLRHRDGPALSLLTTGHAANESAASFLRPDDRRDAGRAKVLLDDAALNSVEKTKTPAARSAWLALSDAERLGILERVHVLDDAHRIEDLDQALEDALWPLPPSGHESDFVLDLWSWWTAVAIDMLRAQRRSISGGELKTKLDDIRDKFLPDNLITVADMISKEDAMSQHGSRTFVRQLEWVGVSTVLIEKAVVDYHRAVTQTTEWLDRNLLEMTEFDRFKEALIDEWEIAFEDMIAPLGEDADDVAKATAGRALYAKLRDSLAVRVRDRYTEIFYSRGTRFEIADGGTHGWHPDFEVLLKKLLEGAES